MKPYQNDAVLERKIRKLILYRLLEKDEKLLREAFDATCRKRKTIFELSQAQKILKLIIDDVELPVLWDRYKKENFYVGNLEWETVCKTVCRYIETALIDRCKI
jgi:hypothetical protein